MDEKLPSYRDIDIDNDEDLSQFCFESDHPELKTNTDYLKLMKELYVLELYRAEVIKAIEVNNELKIQKENNPDEYNRRVISGEAQRMFNLAEDFPNPIPEEKRHEIDWSKYDMIKCEDGIIRCIDDIKTSPNSLLPSSFQNIKVEPSESVHSNPGSDDDKIMVRGRKFDESKPETFNQLWTDEEQTRLEQLLLEYPPERFENRRWAKIAKALGNRTPKQVCSRVQKYFVKLHKAGLSIPGRAPRTRSGNLRKMTKLKKNHHLPTTFFPNIKIESGEHSKTIDDVIKIEPKNDDQDESIDSLDYEFKPKLEIFENVSFPSPNDSEVTVMDCEETLTEMKTEPKEFECEDEQLDLKSKLYESKLDVLLAIKENKSSPEGGYHHYHFKCCFCDEVIVGLRWNCRTCDIYVCSDCVLDMINSKFENCHPEKHPLIILGALDKDLYDYDYYPGNFKSTNHLDPNYRPDEDN